MCLLKWWLGRLCLPIKYLQWSTQPALPQRPITQHKGMGFGGLNLQGLKEWPESEQKWARNLLLKWEHLFAHRNLDLGKTALNKHKITLTNQMPFKEHYGCIPPHMCSNMQMSTSPMTQFWSTDSAPMQMAFTQSNMKMHEVKAWSCVVSSSRFCLI